MNKYLPYIAIAVSLIVLVIVLVGNNQPMGADVANTRFAHGLNVTESGCYAVDGTCVIDSSGNFDGVVTASTGTFSSTLGVSGELSTLEASEAVAAANILTAAESFSTYYLSGSAATTTLPAVATATSTVFRFVVSAAVSGDINIASAEGDNIEGALIVAGAVVDCDAEDKITIVADGENLGDFVELRSDGQKWFIGASGVLSSSKMTCTDPN